MLDFDTVDKADTLVWVLKLFKSNTLLWATFLKRIAVGTSFDLFLRSNFSLQWLQTFIYFPSSVKICC